MTTAGPGTPHDHPPEDAGWDGPSGFAAARGVADAVLYEGYLLYPYRRSSGKNRVRWQFGVLAPRGWVEAAGPPAATVAGAADAWRQRTDCLLEAKATARIAVRLRFLHLQRRSVRDRTGREVDALEVGGVRHLTFDEAVPREVDLAVDLTDLAAHPQVHRVDLPGDEEAEPLPGEAGRVVRIRAPVSAVVRLSVAAATAPFPLHVVTVETENTVGDLAPDAPRAEALRRSLVAAHTLLGVRGGTFLSLLDPPAWAAAAASGCANLHTFPVLAGASDRIEGDDTVLSSPIILYDHPRVAPESPGDLFDAAEIDEILTLRTLTLTDEEKREARATDPRAATVIDRADTIPREVLARLHGAVRSLRPVDREPHEVQPPPLPTPSTPWWDPGADTAVSPRSDAVLVDGHRVARGSRVQLHPHSRGTDAHDMFLEGRTARVEAVLLDVDGSTHLAVTVDDDPGADLHRWYGRHHYFAPDEVVPL
jgi:hypothetical protein